MPPETPYPTHSTTAGRRRPSRFLPLALVAVALMAEAAPFRLVTGTVDSGGEHSQGTRFAVEGTVGQADAGPAQGARFRVEGGFWPAASESPAATDDLFRHSFED